MAAGNSRRREDARRNHTAVIEAALDLLAANPDASMQEVADASGVGRTTVYRHFPNREELFGALLDHAIDHSWRVAAGIIDDGRPLATTVRDLSAAMVDAGVRYRFLLGYRNPSTLQISRSASENPILAFFARAQEAGDVRDDLPLHWIMSCFQALSLVAMQDYAAGRQSRDATAELLAESLLALLLPAAPA